MLKFLKVILWVLTLFGLFGLLWNPFKVTGFKRLLVEDVWMMSFSRRSGFSDSCHKRDIKQLWKDFKKYSKKQPKYVPKTIDILDIHNSHTLGHIIYMGSVSWRKAFKEMHDYAYSRVGYLIFNVPEEIVMDDHFEGRYPSLSVHRREVTETTNRLILKNVWSGFLFGDHDEIEIQLESVRGDLPSSCGNCDEDYGMAYPVDKCPECGSNREMPKATKKALLKAYDRIADKLAAESKAA